MDTETRSWGRLIPNDTIQISEIPKELKKLQISDISEGSKRYPLCPFPSVSSLVSQEWIVDSLSSGKALHLFLFLFLIFSELLS